MKALFLSLTTIGLLAGATATEAELTRQEIGAVRYDQHIGQRVSDSLTFAEADGGTVALGDLFDQKPTLLVLGYYHCPMLCTLINDGLIQALQELRFDIGRDFNVINLSVDPRETPEAAAAKKNEYLKRYGRPGAAKGWHFLTGKPEAIAQLANEVGFRYQPDPVSNEFAHPSGFIVLTPQGKISRYFFGVNFDPKELRSALIAAEKGERGSAIKELVLLCSHYNPITGKYGALVLSTLRFLSVATVLLLGWWIITLCRQRPAPAPEHDG